MSAALIAQGLVAALPDVTAAECMLVSRIGAPIDEPQVLSVRVRIEGDRPVSDNASVVGEIARSGLAGLPTLSERLIAGEIPIY